MATIDIICEVERNRVLRRADWRFLLPNPRPARSICFAGGLLARAVELISLRVADRRQKHHGSCDLAVALAPSQRTLRQAWDALGAGGVCYTEWRSPFAGGARGIRRRLEAAGFEDITCYWPWSDPARSATEFWVPLDRPGALRHFLASRPGTRSKLLGCWHHTRRALWLLALGLNLTSPICAVARKAAPGVGERASPAQPHACCSLLLLTGGPRSTSKAVKLVFEEPSARPYLAIKHARVPEAAAGLAREAATLRAIERAQRGGVPGVPQVRFFDQQGDLCALGETALAGQPLLARLRPDNYRQLALRATDWLAAFAGRPQPARQTTWWPRLVEPVLRSFYEAFGEVADARLWHATQARLAALGDLPLVCEQRDFSPWNVLVTNEGTLVVLDWESAELQGLPALDLIYFLTYLAFFHDGAMRSGRYRESFRATLDTQTFTGSVMAECLGRYACHVGIDPSALPALRLLTWLIHARSEYQRLVADVAGRPERALLTGSLFLTLWEEEIRNACQA